MIIIDVRSRTPVYEQIKEQILSLVNSGELKPDDKLPSIRQLASDLNLNVNTVKRAFCDLEAQQIIYSLPGKGVFISSRARENTALKDAAREELLRVINSAKAKGLSLDEIKEIADSVFKEAENHD